MVNSYYYNSPIGLLCIEEKSGYITGVQMVGSVAFDENSRGALDECPPVIKEAVKQLDEYFEGSRRSFDLPISTSGTSFQEKVWAALRMIPYGKTVSYGDIAASIGKPKAARAVGGANNKNPLLIITPCHRVIGADGSLVGFGAGIDVKIYLLEHEKNHKHIL